jgi:hypothetical protein
MRLSGGRNYKPALHLQVSTLRFFPTMNMYEHPVNISKSTWDDVNFAFLSKYYTIITSRLYCAILVHKNWTDIPISHPTVL